MTASRVIAAPKAWFSARPFRVHPWSALVVSITGILSIPVLVVFGFVLYPSGVTWDHLVETVLADYVLNSLSLMLGVAGGTLSIGVITAWLVTQFSFPGRRIFIWLLLLPLAMPAYIIAYTYTGILDYAGPVQTVLRDAFGWGLDDYWFPRIRSLGGAMVMLSLVLYPYVYLIARSAFLEQSPSLTDASRLLGTGPLRRFFKISLPMARPAIIAGLSLALMETLADFGTVQYFGVPVFTTGIFRVWFGLGDSTAAAQLSALLMTFVFVLIVLERWSRRRARYHHVGLRSRPIQLTPLRGTKAVIAVTACLLPPMLGFLVPTLQLGYWAVLTAPEMIDTAFVKLAIHSFGLALAAAFIAVTIALIVSYGKRLARTPLPGLAARVAGMGYAVPGTVIAVGVMIPFAWMDRTLDAWLHDVFGVSTGLLLSGTLFTLLFAYTVRFLAVSLQTLEAGLSKITTHTDDAARSLGYKPMEILTRIHIPCINGALLTAILIVFVDVLKELPATLILRPFNFNTLAVRTYELASDERLADASMSAIAIVLVGILPILVLSRAIGRSRAIIH
ncbi:MAG: Sulfate transport system permease protein CysW [Gammaproteobacteria bacterium]|nr:Sulfate transport system permease protein CysW [Gammaproteobacteria bacterium]